MLNLIELRESFLNEMEDAYAPCKLIRPSYQFLKECFEFSGDILSLVMPIVFEFGVEYGKEMYRILTSEEAVHFYASVITGVINFAQFIWALILSSVKRANEVKAFVEVYQSASEVEKVEMIQEIKSAVIKKAAIISCQSFYWVKNETAIAVNVVMKRVQFEIEVVADGWNRVWVK